MKTILKKTTIFLFTALILFNISCTKKSTTPSGANVVRMTLDGVNYETSGNSSSFGIVGISKHLVDSPRTFIAHFNNNLYIGLGTFEKIGIVNSKQLTGVFPIQTQNILNAYTRYTTNGVSHQVYYNSFINSGSYTLTDNNSNFISGTFNGTLVQDTTYLNNRDSTAPLTINITNGYFDIPIN